MACAVALSTPCLSAPADVKFDVMAFVVQGNRLLPDNLIDTVLQPYLGPQRHFKDVDAAREALEKAYQDAGYLSVVVSLPNQRVDQGVVRLEVTEAKVDKLTVTGSAYHLPSRVRARLPSLLPGQVPYFPQVQQELAALQSGDQQVTPLINPGSAPDAISVDMKVQDSLPIRASVELNNRQNYNTSRGRLSAMASYNNLFQRGHQIGLSWQYAPWRPADGNTLTAMYGLPLSQGSDLTISATRNDSNTPFVVADGGNTITKGNQYSLRWQNELPARQWPVRHGWTASLDAKRASDRTNFNEDLSRQSPSLRYAVVGLGYNLLWTFKTKGSLGFNTSVNASNRSLAGRQVNCSGETMEQFACKRSGAQPDFMTWRAGLDLRQPLGAGWRLSLSTEAQLASGPLVSGEQYALGGKDSVRGYHDYEQAGDWGWQAKAELTTPALFDLSGWKSLALAFADRGFVGLIDPLPGQQARAHLASIGLGWRLEDGKGLLCALDVARPLIASRRAENDGTYAVATRRHSTHVLLSVRQVF